MLAQEIKINKIIERSEVIDYGLFLHQNTVNAFMIMPRYGINLQQYFDFCGQKFSNLTVLAVGTSLLNIFEKIHDKGIVYNDLKPDNILLDHCAKLPKGYHPHNAFKHTCLHLVDFGFSQKFDSI